MTEHAYNAPGLTPLEFLLAVQEDERLPMSIRMEAAKAAAPYLHAPPPVVKTIHIHISGGIPPADFSDRCTDITDCATRTTPCPWQRLYPQLLKDCRIIAREQILDDMDIQGHA